MGLFTPVIRNHLAEVSHYARGRMLDVGCGNKPYRDLFRGVDSYIGIDRRSETLLYEPSVRSRLAFLDVEADACNLPFHDECFDTVLCTQVLEHQSDPGALLREACRVLRAGGCLLLTAPLVGPIHEIPHDYYRYTEYGLNHLLRGHGFLVVELRGIGGGWLSVGYLLRHFLQNDGVRKRNALQRRACLPLGNLCYAVFDALDRRSPHPELPVNYLVVARKAAPGPAGD